MAMAIPMLASQLMGNKNNSNSTLMKIIAIGGIIGVGLVIVILFGKKIADFFKKLNPFEKAKDFLGGMGKSITNLATKTKEGLGTMSSNANDVMERMKRETEKIVKGGKEIPAEMKENALQVVERIKRIEPIRKTESAIKKGSETLKQQWELLVKRQEPKKTTSKKEQPKKAKNALSSLLKLGGKKK